MRSSLPRALNLGWASRPSYVKLHASHPANPLAWWMHPPTWPAANAIAAHVFLLRKDAFASAKYTPHEFATGNKKGRLYESGDDFGAGVWKVRPHSVKIGQARVQVSEINIGGYSSAFLGGRCFYVLAFGFILSSPSSMASRIHRFQTTHLSSFSSFFFFAYASSIFR